MSADVSFFEVLGLLVVGVPVLLFAYLGVSSLFVKTPLSERAIVRVVEAAIVTGLIASVGMLVMMLVWDDTRVEIKLGSWVHVKNHAEDFPYHFVFKFEFDRLSVPIVILTFLLCGIVGAFANRYMHRERGFNRFFVLFSLFLVGMVTTATAGTIETLFSGWELVGLSSALLVAFYHERTSPVMNGLHVWVIYRISDAALLLASVVLHHMKGEGDFDRLVTGEWPYGTTVLDPYQSLFVGLLLLIAAMGKSAIVPFSGWLPRAMEGPTPSSAVFYGALSVHLGAFLLLRFSSLMDQSPTLRVIVIVVGLVTAVFATFTGNVQTDIKSALAFASLTQVGIIFVEIALGLQYLAIIHILGHGCLRTLQFLRAPNLLYDYRQLEDAIGERLPHISGVWLTRIPSGSHAWYYRVALERGFLDSYLRHISLKPILTFLAKCDAWEQRWTRMLSGTNESQPDPPITPPALEELL